MSARSARTPEECDHLLGEFLAAGDVEAILGLYEQDACFVTQTREVLTGHARIRPVMTELAGGRPRLRSRIVLTVPHADGIVMAYNDWTLSSATPDGSTVEMEGRAVEVMRRQPDGTWLFLLDDPFGRM